MTADSTVEQFLGRVLHTAFILILLLFSFNFCMKMGEKGFFPHDQSIVFDGAYRILSGQVPYRDFWMPFGPVVFWVQALLFRFFGINYSSCILGAAIANVGATLLAVFLVRRLFPSRIFLPYLAGLVTAVWFAPPFGTLWMDQIAFFFSAAALAALLHAMLASKQLVKINLLLIISGCCGFLSFISKQNVGIFALPVCILLIVAAYAPDVRRTILGVSIFTAGLIGSALLLSLWLWVESDPAVFYHYVIKTGAALGRERLFSNSWSLVATLLLGRGPVFNRVITSASLLLSLAVIFSHFQKREEPQDALKKPLLASLVCISLIVFQRLFIHSTINQPENGYPFIGIILATSTGLVLYHLDTWLERFRRRVRSLKPPRLKGVRAILAIVALLVTLDITIAGMSVSLTRKVQESVAGSVFPRQLAYPGLLSLRWGEPTMVMDADVTERDLINTLTYLKGKKTNFFVFPDFSIFYGLLNVPSPHPLLYFAPGETYPVSGDPMVDEKIVQSLVRNRVGVFVVESRSFLGSEELFDDFPLLKSFLETNFLKVGKMGIFEIYKKPETANLRKDNARPHTGLPLEH